jgi:hypothetical protein
MNMKKINIIGALVLFATILIGCTETEFNSIPDSKLMGDSIIVANYTPISQLISNYMNDSDAYTDLKYSAKNAGLFTANLIKSDQDIVIKGVITSTDVEGNVYKYIIIKEDNGQAIKISIDASGLSGLYPLGQRVWVRCNGLYLGKYAQSPQIGTLYFNPTKSIIKTVITYDTIKKMNDTTYVPIYRKEPGRIPLAVAMNAIHAYGVPNPALVKADTLTIAQIKAAGASVVNKLVCIKNAFFTGKGSDYNLPIVINSGDLIFAPSTNGIGYPQSREIQDGTGSVFVSTSEYAKFAMLNLPSSGNRGNITALVGWYNDKKPAVNPNLSTTEIYHQLTIRSLKDLGAGFESFHTLVNK